MSVVHHLARGGIPLAQYPRQPFAIRQRRPSHIENHTNVQKFAKPAITYRAKSPGNGRLRVQEKPVLVLLQDDPPSVGLQDGSAPACPNVTGTIIRAASWLSFSNFGQILQEQLVAATFRISWLKLNQVFDGSAFSRLNDDLLSVEPSSFNSSNMMHHENCGRLRVPRHAYTILLPTMVHRKP